MDDLRNIKLTLEYDGRNFRGWQVQPNARTTQGALESALTELFGARHRVIAASRTDSGAHARGQVVNFYTRRPLPVARILAALNAILPEDVVVQDACEAVLDFNARRSAKSRRYSYRIVTGASALWRDRAWSVRGSLDLRAMQEACLAALGLRDFRAFSSGVEGNGTTLCTLTEFAWRTWEEGSNRGYLCELKADRFVRYMVRTLAGTVARIGQGRMGQDEFARGFVTRTRPRLAYTAPARGLCLEEVIY